MSSLIVNADDFGLTSGVNRAIVELHQAGVLTSTTLMARAAATAEAIALARANPSLGVGCHLVLVDGRQPVLPPHQVPTLIDSHTGFSPFQADHVSPSPLHGPRPLHRNRGRAAAQIALLQSRGLHLTHIDTHKHTHMFPQVLRPVLRAASAADIYAVRNPFEPEWAVRASPRATLVRSAERSPCAIRPYFRRILAEEGFRTTDGTIAVAATGVVNTDTVRALLQQLPQGIWELVTHPGYNRADLDRYARASAPRAKSKRDALRAVKEFPIVDLISFENLSPARTTSKIV